MIYKSDGSDWFFCEVKGPRARLTSGQVELFGELAAPAAKPIRVVRFLQVD